MATCKEELVLGMSCVARASGIVGAGTGLFACQDFAPGDLITFYDGTILSCGDTRMKSVKKETSHLASLGNHTNASVDGLSCTLSSIGRGGASFANDGCYSSRNGMGSIRNNARFILNPPPDDDTTDDVAKYFSNRPAQPVLWIQAVSAIQTGQEILVSYST